MIHPIAYYPADEGIALCPDCAAEHAAAVRLAEWPLADAYDPDPDEDDPPSAPTVDELLEDGDRYAVALNCQDNEREGSAPVCDNCHERIEGFSILCAWEPAGRGMDASDCECELCAAGRDLAGLERRDLGPDHLPIYTAADFDAAMAVRKALDRKFERTCERVKVLPLARAAAEARAAALAAPDREDLYLAAVQALEAASAESREFHDKAEAQARDGLLEAYSPKALQLADAIEDLREIDRADIIARALDIVRECGL